MKVIFLKDIPRVARRHDVKEVHDGYASNFLFPRGLAEPATKNNLAQLEKRKEEIIVKKEVQENLLEKSLSEIKDKIITISMKADPKGHLFSAVHPKGIIKALKEEHNIDIGEEFLILPKPLKQIGEFEIPIQIKEKKSSFKLIINKLK